MLRRFSLKGRNMGVLHSKHRRVHQITAIGIVDSLFFGLTDPARAPSALFIVAFLLIALSLYVLYRGVLDLIDIYTGKRHHHRIAASLTAVTASLLALQSIGQLSARDLAVAVPLIAISYFYFSYNKRQSNSPV